MLLFNVHVNAGTSGSIMQTSNYMKIYADLRRNFGIFVAKEVWKTFLNITLNVALTFNSYTGSMIAYFCAWVDVFIIHLNGYCSRFSLFLIDIWFIICSLLACHCCYFPSYYTKYLKMTKDKSSYKQLFRCWHLETNYQQNQETASNVHRDATIRLYSICTTKKVWDQMRW